MIPCNIDLDSLKMNPNALTNSSKFVNFLEPVVSTINIHDIALGLSKACRFNGQCHGFYSVAEHSVLVSYQVPEHLALQGLLHDATEAYMGDCITPLKQLLPLFKNIEDNLQRVIYRRFGVNEEQDPLVSEADYRMFITESHHIMPSVANWDIDKTIQPYLITLQKYNWKEAYDIFMRRFEELYHGD